MVQLSVIIAVLSVMFLLALWSSYHRVPKGEVEILLVFGEGRDILESGPYFVPPFVSATYSVNLQTMQYESSHGCRSIPAEFRGEVELIAADRTGDE